MREIAQARDVETGTSEKLRRKARSNSNIGEPPLTPQKIAGLWWKDQVSPRSKGLKILRCDRPSRENKVREDTAVFNVMKCGSDGARRRGALRAGGVTLKSRRSGKLSLLHVRKTKQPGSRALTLDSKKRSQSGFDRT